jgi:hypothetical protein
VPRVSERKVTMRKEKEFTQGAEVSERRRRGDTPRPWVKYFFAWETDSGWSIRVWTGKERISHVL